MLCSASWDAHRPTEGAGVGEGLVYACYKKGREESPTSHLNALILVFSYIQK